MAWVIDLPVNHAVECVKKQKRGRIVDPALVLPTRSPNPRRRPRHDFGHRYWRRRPLDWLAFLLAVVIGQAQFASRSRSS
jgi:hypothetical protein